MTGFEAFLAEALPPLGLSPTGFRRRNIRRRVVQRMEALRIHDFPAYLSLVRKSRDEREALRSLLTVTISRFFRNRKIFETLASQVLSPLAAKGRPAQAWSAGGASGEEAFTLRILWEGLPGPRPHLSILATDIDEACLLRAAEGLYAESSLREIPEAVVKAYFRKEGDKYRLREDIVGSVIFQKHDLLFEGPPGVFDLVLCRNAAFTYFSSPCRIAVAGAIASALPPGGVLMLGRTEKLPPDASVWFACASHAGKIYQRTDTPSPRGVGHIPR